MTIYTTKQINDLDRMNRAAANVKFGTNFNKLNTQQAFVADSGSYVVAAADATGCKVTLILDQSANALKGWTFNVARSGSFLDNRWFTASAGSVAGTVVVANIAGTVSGSKLSTGDIVTAFSFA